MITDVCFEELLLKCTQDVFETMIFMDISAEFDPEILACDENEDGILGSITYKGQIEGGLSISCSSKCAKEIALNMLGMEPDEEISNEEVNDAIGEVTNMVVGSIKSSLEKRPLDIVISIPTVIQGRCIKQCFGDNFNKIYTDVCLEDQFPLKILMEYRTTSTFEG